MAKDSFPVSEEEFNAETQTALSGKASNYKFYLDNNTLKWEKDLWTMGSMVLFPETEIMNLSEFMMTTLADLVQNQTFSSSINEENKKLKNENEHLRCKLNEMIKIKMELEEPLLKKFILILNEKKKRIRELVGEIENLRKIYEPTFYDQPTDEEMSFEEKENPQPSTSKIVNFKEEFTESDELDRFKLDVTPSKNNNFNEEKDLSTPNVSLSKNNFNEEKDLLTPNVSSSKNSEFSEGRDLSTPSRRRTSIREDELEDIINNVVNHVPEKVHRSAVKSRKCLSFEESDEEIELKLDSISQVWAIDN